MEFAGVVLAEVALHFGEHFSPKAAAAQAPTSPERFERVGIGFLPAPLFHPLLAF